MYQSMCSETAHTIPGSPPSRSIKTWLTLLRVPNLLTVPGDPLAGAFLAAAGSAAAMAWSPVFKCVLASLSLYSSGLLANDYFDREEDRRERSFRPIPSGAAQPRSVLITAILFSMAANAFAAEAGKGPLLIAMLLTVAVWAYNLGVKRLPFAGPLLMGTCRGLSLLLGAAACTATPAVTPWLAAGLITAYIAIVTSIARDETHVKQTRPVSLFIPATIVLAGLAGLAFVRWDGVVPVLTPHASGLALGISAMAVVWTGVWSGQLAGRPSPLTVQRTVGGLLRGLILIQAALCATTGPIGEVGALAILLAFPIAGWLGKWFYGS
jgi:4-hydroxybenzoate polyprenyltransferase